MNNAPRTLFDWEIQAAAESAKAKAPREEGIRFVGDMQRLKVEPGDVYVVKYDFELSDDEAQLARRQLRAVLGEDAKVLVLSKGMTLGVMAGAANNLDGLISPMASTGGEVDKPAEPVYSYTGDAIQLADPMERLRGIRDGVDGVDGLTSPVGEPSGHDITKNRFHDGNFEGDSPELP